MEEGGEVFHVASGVLTLDSRDPVGREDETPSPHH